MIGPTPPSVGPGIYANAPNTIAIGRPGDSTAGSSAFVRGVPGAGASFAIKPPNVPGPGAHRPEVYGAIGFRSTVAPFVATRRNQRKPALQARAEVRQRGTPPSIPIGARTTFAYEEDHAGQLKRVQDAPRARPEHVVGPGRYSPSILTLSSTQVATL